MSHLPEECFGAQAKQDGFASVLSLACKENGVNTVSVLKMLDKDSIDEIVNGVKEMGGKPIATSKEALGIRLQLKSYLQEAVNTVNGKGGDNQDITASFAAACRDQFKSVTSCALTPDSQMLKALSEDYTAYVSLKVGVQVSGDKMKLAQSTEGNAVWVRNTSAAGRAPKSLSELLSTLLPYLVALTVVAQMGTMLPAYEYVQRLVDLQRASDDDICIAYDLKYRQSLRAMAIRVGTAKQISKSDATALCLAEDHETRFMSEALAKAEAKKAESLKETEAEPKRKRVEYGTYSGNSNAINNHAGVNGTGGNLSGLPKDTCRFTLEECQFMPNCHFSLHYNRQGVAVRNDGKGKGKGKGKKGGFGDGTDSKVKSEE